MKAEELAVELQKILAEMAADRTGHQPGTITTKEFADAQGVSTNRARRHLVLLMSTGKVETTTVTRTNLWGQNITIPGWRWVEES